MKLLLGQQARDYTSILFPVLAVDKQRQLAAGKKLMVTAAPFLPLVVVVSWRLS